MPESTDRRSPGSPSSSAARLRYIYNPEAEASGNEPTGDELPQPLIDRPYDHRLSRTLSGTSTPPQPPSVTLKTPARSFYHSSFRGSLAPRDASEVSSHRVREQTAELASYALSDGGSSMRESSPPRSSHFQADTFPNADNPVSRLPTGSTPIARIQDYISYPGAIAEVSEPASPELPQPSHHQSPGPSALADMLKNSPPDGDKQATRVEDGESVEDDSSDMRRGSSRTGRTSSDTNERTTLLPKTGDGGEYVVQDIEGQERIQRKSWSRFWQLTGRWTNGIATGVQVLANPKRWDRAAIWQKGVVQPVGYLPSVLLGLLLNILDALSYGMILFPLGQPIFANLGPDGISMFYVSCIVSQLVYSCGGSVFKGGIGSEMIEVVPFFHKMAFTIIAEIGEDNPKSVIATTILSYSISSVITGLVFFGMGASRLGSLIGFFPRHILIGCIGGVGWFLVATGLEVSARLDGNLEYSLNTLKKLVQLDTIFLWTTPLTLAVILIICQRWVKNSLFVPCYFLFIPAVFYFFVGAMPGLNLDLLRSQGWVFQMPVAGVPFYHFYSLYDFGAVNWKALANTVPAMFALTFFGVLHVPINVPALGVSTGEDNVDVDRELIAHGVSNALSGFAGSIQNYLVYTNSLLFIRSGGDSRVAGIMLAFGTFGILLIGPALIGYIPIMVVGALIFLLGIDLLREALYDTWGRVHRLEYLTIIAIVVTMGAWDFVVGILVGIILACVNFVVQTSRKSAIRATYSGEIASSTVRRHPVQHRFLREVGQQIHITKLAGFLFFGTIVSVESRIRGLLDEDAFQTRPIRFLILDLMHVTGIDFSAAEAFTRINRLLKAKNVDMIICGVSASGEIGQSLRGVGLWDEGHTVQIFDDLNSALEYTENELLKTLYSRRDALAQRNAQPRFLDVPKSNTPHFSFDTSFSSPRRSQLNRVATTALNEHDFAAASKWLSFKQPLPLLLQTFQDLTSKNEDFWFRACPFFERKEYLAGTVIYNRGDPPTGFYILEDGILRAEYDLPQGKYYESIVAGTTCGELPFFSETNRTATVAAERDSIAWLMNDARWEELQKKDSDVAQELLRISLKLTSERMSAITSYVLTTAG